MNKKRTRTLQYHECSVVERKSDKVSLISDEQHNHRQFFFHECVTAHPQSEISMRPINKDHFHMTHQQSYPRCASQSYLRLIDNVDTFFTSHKIYIWQSLTWLVDDDVSHDRSSDRHDAIRKNMIRNLRLFILVLSLLHYSMTPNSIAFAWTTLRPSTTWNIYVLKHNHMYRDLHPLQNYPSQFTDNYQRQHHKVRSSIFSSSNSYTSVGVQILNDYDKSSFSSDSPNNRDDTTNQVFDSATDTNEYIPESIYQNATNDDNASLSNDSDSFWVTSPDSDGNDDIIDDNDGDIPRPTENGGYSHTQASRAKISAANKGKVPWNKGMNRTDEVKARIAAGVRAKNRERHLQKLQDIGITEEEYEAQKRAERSAKEAERRARRTENGGYRPTEETKRKISEILKQKFAAGEIKPRPISPIHVRRGFTHSEETRQKISESLRKRWSTDPAYRAKMVDVSTRMNTKEEVRQKISESLRNKWQTDDTFRNDMMSKIAARKRRVINPDTGSYEVVHHDTEHRAKISAAMKAKWQDKEYREKTLQSLALRRNASTDVSGHRSVAKSTNRPPTVPRTPKSVSNPKSRPATPRQTLEPTVKQKVPIAKSVVPITNSDMKEQFLKPLISKSRSVKIATDDTEDAILLRPIQPLTAPHKKGKKASTQAVNSEKVGPYEMNDGNKMTSLANTVSPKKPDALSDEDDIDAVYKSEIAPSKKEAKAASTAASSGNVELLKTERRDLYDLLYGDDDNGDVDDSDLDRVIEDDDTSSTAHINDDYDESTLTGSTTPTLASIFARLEDDNLDTFDPYGLDDF